MNTPTLVLTIFTLWLVTGLGFLAEYANTRRQGKSPFEAWTSIEGLLFVASVVVPLVFLIHSAARG